MSLAPLLAASPVIQVHVFAALVALALGGALIIAPKGTVPHRTLGYVWVALMALVAGGSFWIHTINQWAGFSLIHLLSIYTLLSLAVAVAAVRRRRLRVHRNIMLGLFVFALIGAGLFTFLPGRMMHAVVFGGEITYQPQNHTPHLD